MFRSFRASPFFLCVPCFPWFSYKRRNHGKHGEARKELKTEKTRKTQRHECCNPSLHGYSGSSPSQLSCPYPFSSLKRPRRRRPLRPMRRQHFHHHHRRHGHLRQHHFRGRRIFISGDRLPSSTDSHRIACGQSRKHRTVSCGSELITDSRGLTDVVCRIFHRGVRKQIA